MVEGRGNQVKFPGHVSGACVGCSIAREVQTSKPERLSREVGRFRSSVPHFAAGRQGCCGPLIFAPRQWLLLRLHIEVVEPVTLS